MICRLCGAANPPQQASCTACGTPLEHAPEKRGGPPVVAARARRAVWVSACLSLGAAISLVAARARLAGPPTAGKALLAILVGALAGVALGTLPGPLLKAARRTLALGCRLFCEGMAKRKLARIRRSSETSAAEGDRDAQFKLAAVSWLEGAPERAEQALHRLTQAEPDWQLARHNLGVVQAAAGRLGLAADELEQVGPAIDASSPRLWNLGLVRWHQRAWEQAAEAFARLIRAIPQDCRARNAFALALAQQGRAEESIGELEAVLKLHRRHPDALCNLGVVHQARGEMGVAEQHFSAAVGKEPAHVAARHNRAVCQMLRGWYQPAIGDLAIASRLAPRLAGPVIQQAICWYRLGHPGRALECARRAARLEESSFEVRYNAGTLMAREHLVEPALKELERAYELRTEEVDVIINLGVACHLVGRPRQALDHFRVATRINPRHALARYNCAVAFHMVDMLAEAEEQLEELVAAYPDFPEAFNAIGVIRVLEGRLVEAVGQFRRGADAMPRSALVRANLGLTYYLQGDVAAAAEQLRWAGALDPGLAAAHDIAGHVALQMGEIGAAIEHFRALARLEPSNPDAHSNLGLAYYRDDRLNEAVECYKRALIFSPHSPEGHNDLGLAYAKNKMLDEALRHLSRVKDWRPGNPIICSNMGVVYYFKGAAEQAVEQWREVTRLSPAYAQRREATRFSAYDDQEMTPRPPDARKRLAHFPPKVAGFRHSFAFALDEGSYRMAFPSSDLLAVERWQERAERARTASLRP